MSKHEPGQRDLMLPKYLFIDKMDKGTKPRKRESEFVFLYSHLVF